MSYPPLKSEIGYLNRMYSNSSLWYDKCIVCRKPLKKGEEVAYCNKCKPLLLDLADDFNNINIGDYPDLKFDSALLFLALRKVLPKIDHGQHWLSFNQLQGLLELNRHYQILMTIRSATRIRYLLSCELKRAGWLRKSYKSRTYYRQELLLAEEVTA